MFFFYYGSSCTVLDLPITLKHAYDAMPERELRAL